MPGAAGLLFTTLDHRHALGAQAREPARDQALHERRVVEPFDLGSRALASMLRPFFLAGDRSSLLACRWMRQA